MRDKSIPLFKNVTVESVLICRQSFVTLIDNGGEGDGTNSRDKLSYNHRNCIAFVERHCEGEMAAERK